MVYMNWIFVSVYVAIFLKGMSMDYGALASIINSITISFQSKEYA